MEQPRVKPVVVLPETAPLIHLAAANLLFVLNGMGRVIIPDIVALEATFDPEKPFAKTIAAWIQAGQTSGTNQPVEIADTEIGSLYKLAAEQGLRRPRNAGEIGIATWLTENLATLGGPALVIYENGRIPNMLSREGVAVTVAVATTRNLLQMAEQEGLISSAEAAWTEIIQAAPTANPAANITFINPVEP